MMKAEERKREERQRGWHARQDGNTRPWGLRGPLYSDVHFSHSEHVGTHGDHTP